MSPTKPSNVLPVEQSRGPARPWLRLLLFGTRNPWLGPGGLPWAAVVLLALYLMGIGAAFLLDRRDRAAMAEYQQSLDAGAASAVPLGSDAATAEAWLASQGMSVSRERSARSGGFVKGIKRQQFGFGWNDVSVYFFLDAHGKVAAHEVHHRYNGS